MIQDRLLPLGQVALRFSVSRRTIYRWVQEGKIFKLDRVKKLPGGVRIFESEVKRAMEELPEID